LQKICKKAKMIVLSVYLRALIKNLAKFFGFVKGICHFFVIFLEDYDLLKAKNFYIIFIIGDFL